MSQLPGAAKLPATNAAPVGAVELALPPGNYEAQWLNPVTGRTERTQTFSPTGGRQRVEWPPFTEDIALSIRRTKSSR